MVKKDPDFILASSSVRRQQILSSAAIEFKIMGSGIKEIINPQSSPFSNALRLARKKAMDVSSLSGSKSVVIAADTLVYHGGNTSRNR